MRRLTFAEVYFSAANSRIFNVLIDGVVKIASLVCYVAEPSARCFWVL